MTVCIILSSWSFALSNTAKATDDISPVLHPKQFQKIDPKDSRVSVNNQLDFHAASTCTTSCTVSFNPNQADTPPPVNQSVPVGGFAVWPDDPVRSGYFFDGWFNGSAAYDFSHPVTNNLTLTAHWTKDEWSINPDHESTHGGQQVTITPIAERGIKLMQVTSGDEFTLVLGSDGNAYSWGSNENGQLGDNTTTRKIWPVKVVKPENLGHFIQVSGRDDHMMALDEHGGLWVWGQGAANMPSKVPMPAGVNHFKQAIASRGPRLLALDDQGVIWAWANGSAAPVRVGVSGSVGHFTQVSAGYPKAIAIDDQGAIWEWEYNANTPVASKRGTPVGAGRFVQISAGYGHFLAIDDLGNTWAWGNNSNGELGDNTTTSRATAVKVNVPAEAGAFTQIVADFHHSVAIGMDGNAYSWGRNREGQVGDGTTTDKLVPVKVVSKPGMGRFIAISTEYHHSAGIDDQGHVWTWGLNSSGQLGTGDTVGPQKEPVRSAFPEKANLKSVKFDGVSGTSLTDNGNGTWTVTTPVHANGPADVTVSWALNDKDQPDKHLNYVYGAFHTVTFDKADGLSPPDRQQVYKGGRAVWPADPVRQGYSFDGWFLGGVAYDFAQPVLDDITLTARWTKESAWIIRPDRGPTTGGTTVTLAPPTSRGVTFAQISAGRNSNDVNLDGLGSHSLAVGSDGNVYAWGRNNAGQLGDGTLVDRKSPIKVDMPAAAGHIVQVETGYRSSVAINEKGDIYAWGWIGTSKAGPNNSVIRIRPQKLSMPADAGSFTDISAGFGHVLAVDNKGQVWSWGSNDRGQLGNSSYADSPTPVKVTAPTGAGPFVQVSAGSSHSVALDDKGQLWAWGNNSFGELAKGNTTGRTNRPAIIVMPAGAGNITQISSGTWNTMILDDKGQVWAWGNNSNGQIGNGNTATQTKPVQVAFPSNAGHITQISFGGFHALAADDRGQVWAWGWNSDGQLGNGNTSDQYTPVRATIPSGLTSLVRISAGYRHSLVVGSDGSTWALGYNAQGQLGDGTNTNRAGFVRTDPYDVVVTSVTFDGLQGTHLGQQTDGTWKVTTPSHAKGQVDVKIVWNVNGDAQPDETLHFTYYHSYLITYDKDDGQSTPERRQAEEGERLVWPPDPVRNGYLFDGWFVGDAPYDFTQPVTGDLSLTAHWTKADRQWTIDPSRGSVSGGTEVTLTPPAPRGIRFFTVEAGKTHSMALGSDGGVYVWGSNANHELGDGTTVAKDKPAKLNVPGVKRFTQISPGDGYSTAIDSQGQLWVWGDNTFGQLGDGGTSNRSTPTKLSVPAVSEFTRVSAGVSHSLAIDDQGQLWAWGSNASGQLGDGSGAHQLAPVKLSVPGAGRFVSIAAGVSHSLAVDDQGQLWAWGSNASGQLGDGSTGDHAVPVKVSATVGAARFTRVSAGVSHSLAIDDQGQLWAWGSNASGQLGDGSGAHQLAPVKLSVPGAGHFTQVSAKGDHSFTVDDQGQLWAWGDNSSSQLGTGVAGNQGSPAKLSVPGAGHFTHVGTGRVFSLALDDKGQMWAWGDNAAGQLGSHADHSRENSPVLASQVPHNVEVNAVTFDGVSGINLVKNADGTWKVTTPGHSVAFVPVKIAWNLNGTGQPDDTANQFEYYTSLPLTGGKGIGLILILGLLVMGSVVVYRKMREGTEPYFIARHRTG
ncbi:InlB B-repeat-containing protein [Bombiscardovia coagulans]|nr:InlB B-repeat-containing protein [Bombiscardovia coagulans]